MNLDALGLQLARNRRNAGLTQAALARRMGTTQPAIARVESGNARPSIDFLERFAVGTQTPIVLELGTTKRTEIPARQRRERIRAAMGDVIFDPWERHPAKVEQQALLRRGLTREHFQNKRTAR